MGGRLYTDFYYKKKLIDSDDIFYSESLSEEDIKKLGISWNVGLADLFGDKEKSYKNPSLITSIDSFAPTINRRYDVQFRGTYDYSICGYQRNKSMELLKNMDDIICNDMITKLCFEDYLREMSESKITVSPFGWGEICTRDFEAFLMGALLLKPDMSHLNTYPNWYINNETYVATQWDFSNFEEKIHFLLENPDIRLEIANNAQKMFKYHRNNDLAKEEFVKHIINQINK